MSLYYVTRAVEYINDRQSQIKYFIQLRGPVKGIVVDHCSSIMDLKARSDKPWRVLLSED